jgi:tetratricopeptide (TPR) repeat protein
MAAVVCGCARRAPPRRPEADAVRQGGTPASVVDVADEYLALPAERIDLARALLDLSEAAQSEIPDPEFGASECLRRIDGISRDCARRLPEGASGPEAVGVLNGCLFGRLGLEPVFEDGGGLATLFPDSVLREKRGSCLALAGLYLAVADRLELPVYGVVVPGHFFVRYDDGGSRVNVELLRRGIPRTDDFYAERFRVPEGSGVYLRSLDARETLAVFLFNLANAYRDAGRTDEAMRLYERVVDVLPGLAEAHGNLGVLDFQAGDVERAIARFEKALSANPGLAGVHLDLGAAHQSRGRMEEAEAAYVAGLRVAPEDAELHHALGTIHHAAGRLDEAISAYARALAVRPDFTRAHRNLAAVYLARGQRELAEHHLARSRAPPLDPGAAGGYSQLRREGAARTEPGDEDRDDGNR